MAIPGNQHFANCIGTLAFSVCAMSSFLYQFFSPCQVYPIILPCTSRLANSTPAASAPSLLSSCCSLTSTLSASVVRLFSHFSSFLVTLNFNPGPADFTICTFSKRSIPHPLHSAAFSDLIDTQNHDLFKPTTTSVKLLSCTPPRYSISTPRSDSSKTSSSGSGTGFLIREPFLQSPTSVPNFSSFESSAITLQLPHLKISVFNIYRPPSSSTFSKPYSVFLEDFNSFLSIAATTRHKFIITGDFNIHLDNSADHFTSQFLSLLSSVNLAQRVNFPTHDKNHILDLVITFIITLVLSFDFILIFSFL